MKPAYTRSITSAVLALVVGLSLATTAAARPHGHGRDRLSSLERRLERLDLSNETRMAIDSIMDQARVEQRTARRQLHTAYQALRELMEKDTPDEAAVLAQADAIGKLQTERQKQMLQTVLAVQAKLTPEQRASLRQSMHDRGGRRHGPGHRRSHDQGRQGADKP